MCKLFMSGISVLNNPEDDVPFKQVNQNKIPSCNLSHNLNQLSKVQHNVYTSSYLLLNLALRNTVDSVRIELFAQY